MFFLYFSGVNLSLCTQMFPREKMQFKNTFNNTNKDGAFLFLKKRFAFLLLFLCTLSYSQITISEGATIDGYETDSASAGIENQSITKIYISSGVTISNLDSKNNYEIVETISSEKKKIESTKNLASKIEKPELETKTEHKIVSKKENSIATNTGFSTSKSEVYFSFSGGFSKVTVPVSQFNINLTIIHSESYNTSLAFQEGKLALVYFKSAEIFTAQNKSAFSVRPPPFLA